MKDGWPEVAFVHRGAGCERHRTRPCARETETWAGRALARGGEEMSVHVTARGEYLAICLATTLLECVPMAASAGTAQELFSRVSWDSTAV